MAQKNKQQRRKQKKQQERKRSGGPILHLKKWTGKKGLPKMSDTLVSFAEPLLDAIPSNARAKDWDRALLSAAMAWNGVVAGEEAKVIAEMEKAMGYDSSVHDVMNMLFERKRRLFQHDTRLIVNAQAIDTPEGVRVIAASTSTK
jgi:hypothetical protein